jgi:hypothetical protein
MPCLILVDQEIVAKLAEMDMVVSDLEQAKSRVAAVERRNVCTPSFRIMLAYGRVFRKFSAQKLKHCEVAASLRIGGLLFFSCAKPLY